MSAKKITKQQFDQYMEKEVYRQEFVLDNRGWWSDKIGIFYRLVEDEIAYDDNFQYPHWIVEVHVDSTWKSKHAWERNEYAEGYRAGEVVTFYDSVSDSIPTGDL